MSASYNCHPNYASHLIDKNTLTIEKINIILSRIITSRKNSFDINYIEKLYIDHQINNIDDSQALIVLKERLIKQDVLVIAPGHSILKYKESIDEIISTIDPIIVSTNYIPDNISCNYTFVSNSKRFEQLIDNNKYIDTNSTFILTSNIQTKIIDGLVINQESLLNEIHLIEDNAVLMFIKLLSKVGVNKIFLAGFDGYSTDTLSNYVSDEVSLSMNKNLIIELNENISKIIKEMSKVIRIEFITPTIYIKEEQ